MVKFLIQRPVAVITIFSILIVTGMLLLFRIPVSLLPNIDVPQILVKINYPQASASVVEENFTKRARESLAMLRGLKHIESQSSDNLGLISLTFDYSTPMNTAYLSVTEKLDRLAGAMPPTLQRPEVIRLNTSDIPVMRLQVIPSRQADYLSISDFTEKILKRRLEQIEGVSLVDIHGLRKSNIIIRPNRARLLALGLREQDVVTAVRQANREMSSLSVRDGFYRYFVKVNNNLDGADAIARLPIRLENGAVISLDQVANVEESTDTQTGYHFYNGSEALVVAIHKQPDSRMTDVVERVREMTALFTKDYPQARFELTQDQSFLMNAGIDNLYQDLFYGGGLTVLLLFLFLGNWQSPLLMSINIPISLAISVVFFYLFNISFNIISLSGLTLGIGMLIDNSIVVIDSITREEKSWHPRKPVLLRAPTA
ncbi:efflux RND transporter permease subunit [Chitinophaga sedimenti]|uniref:efflux RND transporter permease subunit n=1 Tax=Chitinophaga sedimenti TaxID=2033606 RepID=UPI00249E2808|nr:efflux RND transporter permease subunit [Chitinophaga sedimenti]